MRALAVVCLMLAGSAGCNAVLGIEDHPLADDGGPGSVDGAPFGDGGLGRDGALGGDGSCPRCVLGTSTVGNCCVQ